MNSSFSLLTGLIMLLFSEKLQSFFNIEHSFIFPVIGINLIVFSIFVWFVSKQKNNKVLVQIISILDFLWVLGSLLIIIFNIFDLSKNGTIVIGVVAIWIGFLGFKQYQYN